MYVSISKPFPGCVYGFGSIDQKENKLAERHVIGVVKRKESVTSQESETHVQVIAVLWRKRHGGGGKRWTRQTLQNLCIHVTTNVG